MRKKFSNYPLILFVAVFFCACQEKAKQESSMPAYALGPLPIVTMELGGVTIEMEVAITSEELQQGLMYRDSMPENHGMLFVYPAPRYMSFWMKNTKIPLSIAFIREDGTISNIEKMKPHTAAFEPVERYISKYKCIYALEMNQGWFEQHGVQAGDVIEMPKDRIQELIRARAR